MLAGFLAQPLHMRFEAAFAAGHEAQRDGQRQMRLGAVRRAGHGLSRIRQRGPIAFEADLVLFLDEIAPGHFGVGGERISLGGADFTRDPGGARKGAVVEGRPRGVEIAPHGSGRLGQLGQDEDQQ